MHIAGVSDGDRDWCNGGVWLSGTLGEQQQEGCEAEDVWIKPSMDCTMSFLLPVWGESGLTERCV